MSRVGGAGRGRKLARRRREALLGLPGLAAGADGAARGWGGWERGVLAARGLQASGPRSPGARGAWLLEAAAAAGVRGGWGKLLQL